MSPGDAKPTTIFSHFSNSDESKTDQNFPSAAVVRQPSTLQTPPNISSTNRTPPVAELPAAKKPRGRPLGSKNKIKMPELTTPNVEASIKMVVLEIAAGSDIIEMITSYAVRRRVGITLVSCSGCVSNVSLRYSVLNAPNSVVFLSGTFQLLTLWGSFMGFEPAALGSQSIFFPAGVFRNFSITLSGVQGQVFGGLVVGKLVAASQVILVATTYGNPHVQNLPTTPLGGEEDGQELQEARASIGESSGLNPGWCGSAGSK